MVIEWDLSYTSSLRRGYIVVLFENKSVFEEFKKTHWPCGSIDAFCHLRKARRPFKMDRIVHAVNPDTGEVLNPYCLVAAPRVDDRPAIESVLWQALPAIKALKFFALSTRGWGQRERDRVTQFVQEIGGSNSLSKEEITEWVHKLRCGDLHTYRNGDTIEYTEILQNIPKALLDRCRDVALSIARGSGRKLANPTWTERIESEFNPTPQVKKPERNEAAALSIIISVQLPKQGSNEQ